LQSVLRAIGRAGSEIATQSVVPTFADIAFASINSDMQVPASTPYFVVWSSVAELAAALADDRMALPAINSIDALIAALAAAPVVSARRRPLAAQLAVAAARNMRKGRKSRSFIAPKPSVLRAKPIAKSTLKKRAPKRRHVWLSAQVRVIRPIATNVVSLARTVRSPARPSAQKTSTRMLRLAA
jgi:hypothetical protein